VSEQPRRHPRLLVPTKDVHDVEATDVSMSDSVSTPERSAPSDGAVGDAVPADGGTSAPATRRGRPARKESGAELDLLAGGLLGAIPSTLVESLRYVLNRYQLGNTSAFPSRLAVVAALHGEGVTTISRSLAAVIANDFEREVCWVDLTWPISASSAALSRNGLAQVVEGSASVDDCLEQSEHRGLSLMTSFVRSKTQRDVLSRSHSVASAVADLAERFDCLVFDIPPILAGSFGLAQVRFAEKYVMVVRHGVTSAQQLRAATEELRSMPSIGVVLNQFRSRIPSKLAHFFAS
jgi:Mrp family chromosome partitioning ATPase